MPGSRYSTDEDSLVRSLYGSTTAEAIGERLGRSAGSVHKRAQALGLQSGRTRGRAWTERDDKELWWLWGSFAPDVVARRTGRTLAACKQRARVLGIGSSGRGATTLAELARNTGYDESRLKGAIEYLGLRTRKNDSSSRSARGKHHAISSDQVEEILEMLSRIPDGVRLVDSRWGRGNRPQSCRGCQQTERPHKAKGLCGRCYASSLRKGSTPS